jgi:CRP/FNR family transcriptional regulator
LHLFYRFASEYGKTKGHEMIVNLKITQQELADMIGSSRVAVAKALKELKTANIIGRENRYYVLKEDPCLAIHEFE